MPDTTSNILITTNDNTAVLGTDYATNGDGLSLAHIPIQKLAWGNENQGYRVSNTYPLPVNILGVSGSLLGVTFGAITGSVSIRNQPNTFIVIGGPSGSLPTNYASVPVVGYLQGVTNGILLGVTGTVNVKNNLFVQGITDGILVGTTGGRRLHQNTDAISVYGSVGLSGGLALTAGNNSVAVWGADGGQKVLTRLYAGDGATLGHSGDALNVNVVGAAISATVTVGTLVGVTNGSETGSLRIRGSGITSDHPVLVKGVIGSGELAVTALTPLSVGVTGEVSINDTDIISSLESSTKPLVSNLSSIKTNTAVISTINDKLSSGTVTSKISEIVKPTKLYSGFKEFSTTATVITNVSTIIKTGAHLKAPITNTNTIYIGSNNLSTSGLNGYPLEPGESIFFEIDNLNKMYVISSNGTQKINYIAS